MKTEDWTSNYLNNLGLEVCRDIRFTSTSLEAAPDMDHERSAAVVLHVTTWTGFLSERFTHKMTRPNAFRGARDFQLAVRNDHGVSFAGLAAAECRTNRRPSRLLELLTASLVYASTIDDMTDTVAGLRRPWALPDIAVGRSSQKLEAVSKAYKTSMRSGRCVVHPEHVQGSSLDDRGTWNGPTCKGFAYASMFIEERRGLLQARARITTLMGQRSRHFGTGTPDSMCHDRPWDCVETRAVLIAGGVFVKTGDVVYGGYMGGTSYLSKGSSESKISHKIEDGLPILLTMITSRAHSYWRRSFFVGANSLFKFVRAARCKGLVQVPIFTGRVDAENVPELQVQITAILFPLINWWDTSGLKIRRTGSSLGLSLPLTVVNIFSDFDEITSTPSSVVDKDKKLPSKNLIGTLQLN
ncbi:hypothetical protein SCHPADRAFT_889327 [Schizopora paradoxa]|uniref:Uncharacterized protein n=1 Tax=Schizopora paradoxa TaxID=27342 RepID=A0A0H2RR61_9AGAM|nr:hypothetical protein SCHPADRAFT_889327 [Schizopora paradoxa]